MTAQFTGDRLEKARVRFAGRMARNGVTLAGPLARQVTDIANAAADRPAVVAAAGGITALLADAGSPASKDLVLEAMACFHGHPNWDSLSAQLPRPGAGETAPAPGRGSGPTGHGSVANCRSACAGTRCTASLMRTASSPINSAWLNREGDYLGFGDLSRNDMVRIALGIEPGELFVVLPDAPGQRGMAARVRGSMPACRPIACKPGTGGRTQGKPAVRLSSVNLPEAFAHRVWQSLPNRRSTAEFR